LTRLSISPFWLLLSWRMPFSILEFKFRAGRSLRKFWLGDCTPEILVLSLWTENAFLASGCNTYPPTNFYKICGLMVLALSY
jgi:hypothetical protein